MPAEKTTRSASTAAPSASSQAGDPVRAASTAVVAAPGVHGDAELLDVPEQGAAAGLVDLHRHQPGRHLHDVGLQPELAQRVGRLEAEQAAADHRRRAVAVRAAARIASRSSIVR